MAEKEHLKLLSKGAKTWNEWRQKEPLVIPNLEEATLKYAELAGFDLRKAILDRAQLTGANLRDANLSEASLIETNLSGAYDRPPDLTNADLTKVNAHKATFKFANLHKINLSSSFLVDTILKSAHMDGAIIRDADLRNADLREVDFQGVDLSFSNLSNSCLYGARFVDSKLDGANLSGCQVFGVSAWNVSLENTVQTDLIVTHFSEPEITVDNLEMAQFIHLLMKKDKARGMINTITQKVVLILGRFTPKRKAILDAIREELRKNNYIPILFDFEKPSTRDITETVSTLAHLSRFVIADITDAKSIPQELMQIVPALPSVPVLSIIEKDAQEYGMFEHFRRFPWVIGPFNYENESFLLELLREKLFQKAEDLALKQANLPLLGFDENHILNLLKAKDKSHVLISKSLLDQLATSLYIFDDVIEVMETACKADENEGQWELIQLYEKWHPIEKKHGIDKRKSEGHWEILGIYSDAVPIALKAQVIHDGWLLITGIQELRDRGGISMKDYKWHECEGKLIFENSCWKCGVCGYIAYDISKIEDLPI